MKVFFDTNIFLDILLDRNHSKEALILLNSVDMGILEGYLVDISILNIDYIGKKQKKSPEIKEFLQLLIDIFNIIAPDKEIFKESLKLQNNDLEDNVQYLTAKKYKCDCIISNDKKFSFEDIEILTSPEFIKKYFLH